MEEAVEWVIEHKEKVFYHPWVAVLSSWVAYANFGFIIYACHRKRVLSKRMPDVLLILLFAFFSDFLRMRMNLYFIYRTWNEPDTRYYQLPTTITACTLGMWIFYSHFMITFIEAIVSIYRFAKLFLKRALSVWFVSVGVGCVCAVQAGFVLETFLHGTPWRADHSADFPITCTKMYILNDVLKFNKWAAVCSMAIAPVLSFLLILNEMRRDKKEAGVCAFTFVSSLALSALVHGCLLIEYLQPGQKYWRYEDMYVMITYSIQDFRFPFLCMLAMFFVADIRDAIRSTVMETIRKMFGSDRPKGIEPFTNEAFVE